MTELHVEKKKSNGWVWILLILILLGILAYWYFNRENQPVTDNTAPIEDTSHTDQGSVVATTVADFSNVDFSAPENRLDEITDGSIKVRENDEYSIYDLGDNILFDKGKSELKPSSKAKLKEIAASINKRYSGNRIAIFGNADSDGDQQMNHELAMARAQSVKDVLEKEDNINSSLITTKSFGENKPVAPNENPDAKQLNRNVQIVVIKQK